MFRLGTNHLIFEGGRGGEGGRGFGQYKTSPPPYTHTHTDKQGRCDSEHDCFSSPRMLQGFC